MRLIVKPMRQRPRMPMRFPSGRPSRACGRLQQETGLEVVILRPPLVYGPGVKANFQRLMQMVNSGWPLPLGAIRNRRSLLYLGNFVDAIRVCVEHPAAAGQTFLLDDGEPVSTPELIRAVARALGRPARLLAVPVRMLEARRSAAGQACGGGAANGFAVCRQLRHPVAPGMDAAVFNGSRDWRQQWRHLNERAGVLFFLPLSVCWLTLAWLAAARPPADGSSQ